jgi:hypothetical protein
MIWRGFCEYTYVTCARCNRKVPVSMCQWDAGLLVCTDEVYGCADRAINGSLELRWMREVALDRQELTPDPKMVNPADVAAQLETIPASSGTY